MCRLSLFIVRCQACPCPQVSCVFFKSKHYFLTIHLVKLILVLIVAPAWVIFGTVFLPAHGHVYRDNADFTRILEAKRRSPSSPLAGGQFRAQKDLRKLRIIRMLLAEFYRRGEETLECPLQQVCVGFCERSAFVHPAYLSSPPMFSKGNVESNRAWHRRLSQEMLGKS